MSTQTATYQRRRTESMNGAHTETAPATLNPPSRGTRYPELFAALTAEFDRSEVKTLNKGKAISYVTARTVMNRLDEVLGPENWIDRYRVEGDAIVCELSITMPDGYVLTKCDAGGPETRMPDPGDRAKSAYSDALKRAAAKFGVGRYLYNDGVPEYRCDEPEPPAKPAKPNAPEPPKTWDELANRLQAFDAKRGLDADSSVFRDVVRHARKLGAPASLPLMSPEILAQSYKHARTLINLIVREGGAQ